MNYYSFLKTSRTATAQDTDWKKHDDRFHGGAYDPSKMRCSLRDDLAKEDGVDDLGNPRRDSKDPAGPKRWIEFLSLIDRKKGGKEVEPGDIEQMYGELQKISDQKTKKAAAWWLAHGTVKLPDDSEKIAQALDVAKKAKKDPLSYRSPMELIEANHKFTPSAKPIDPDTVKELSDRKEMGHGVVTYLVQDDREGQMAMRQIINTHWGKDANPWCLLQGDGEGNLTDKSWEFWNNYNKKQKRVAFKDGKLLAFMGTDRCTDLHFINKVFADDPELYEKKIDEYLSENPGIDFETWVIGREDEEFIPDVWWDRLDNSHQGVLKPDSDWVIGSGGIKVPTKGTLGWDC